MKKTLFEHKEWVFGLALALVIGGVCLVRLGRIPFNGEDAGNASIEKSEIKKQADIATLSETSSKNTTVTVYVCGSVKKPGLYSLSSLSRVGDALACAGGFSSRAAIEALNLAQILKDGEQLYFPSKKEFAQNDNTTFSGQTSSRGVDVATSKVNLNTASQSEIETLSGVGPVTAQKIVEYRDEKGKISSFEDLKNIPGIGDKRVETIKSEAFVQ